MEIEDIIVRISLIIMIVASAGMIFFTADNARNIGEILDDVVYDKDKVQLGEREYNRKVPRYIRDKAKKLLSKQPGYEGITITVYVITIMVILIVLVRYL